MPPKKAAGGPSKKEAEKKKVKVIEDKTFGMKNKKGNKNQKFIAQVEASVRGLPQKTQAKKKEPKDDLADLNMLFKPVQETKKIAADVDPKSVLCAFFKAGLCGKGNKCKYSHDMSVVNKSAKRNLYFDSRDADKKDEEAAETNENWTEAQLAEVASKKHEESDKKRPNQTEIVCKYFLDAVEESKYGWFWECPNGAKCIYKHALPPGYILKKDRKRLEELKKLDTISLEELIENERQKLDSSKLTKVTLQTFIAWKKSKIMERRKKAAEEEKQKKANVKSGKQNGLSGRDLFLYNAVTADADDEEAEAGKMERDPEDQDDGVKAFEIDERTFYNLLDDGKMIDDDLEELDAGASEEQAQPTVFNENLFDDADIPDSDEDDEDDEEDGDNPGPSTGNTSEKMERLKV